MMYVYGFVVAAVVVVAGGLAAMRGAGRVRERADMERLTVKLPAQRLELTCVVGAHRSDATAVDGGHIAKHHTLDRWTLRRVLSEPTAAYTVVVGTEYGTGERSIVTGHSGPPYSISASRLKTLAVTAA